MRDRTHALAIDVTEHFQVGPGGRGAPARHWHRFPQRVARNAEKTLELLDRKETLATFFVDGWIARRQPQAVAEIASCGHEIGIRFRAGEDLEETRDAVAAASGQDVVGCRIAPGSEAVFDADAAKSAGLRYVVAARAPKDLRTAEGGLQFVPTGGYMSTGEWLRLLPRRAVEPQFGLWTRGTGPGLFMLNLWELDEGVQRLALHKSISHLRAYRNTEWLPGRLSQFLGAASFSTVGEMLGLAPSLAKAPVVTEAEREIASSHEPEGEPVSMVIPCFNEEEGLAYLRNAIADLVSGFGRRHPLDFVLVDDGSTDGTWREMRRLFGNDARVALVQHERNRGIGAAVLTGTRAAKSEIVAVMDSDCSYDPARLEDMLALLAPDVALVTASPYHAQGGVEGVPGWRLFLSRGASRLYGALLTNKLATYTSCFRVFRKRPVSELTLRREGYIGVVEMLARLDLQGWRIVECPVVLETRLLGKSKLKVFGTIAGHLKFMREIIIWKLSGAMRQGEIKTVR